MSIQPEKNQLWQSLAENLTFRIIDTPLIDGKKWVYYVNEKNGREYSCYEESFVNRFSPIVNRG